MAPLRFLRIATLCAALMCCAGMLQLAGINRIVVTKGRIDAPASTLRATSLTGDVDINFRSETFPLER